MSSLVLAGEPLSLSLKYVLGVAVSPGACCLGSGALGRWVFGRRGWATAEAAVNVGRQPLGDEGLEGRVVHVAGEDFLVLVHSLNEQGFEEVAEDEGELVFGVDLGGLPQGSSRQGRFDDLVEE